MPSIEARMRSLSEQVADGECKCARPRIAIFEGPEPPTPEAICPRCGQRPRGAVVWLPENGRRNLSPARSSPPLPQ